MGCPSRGWDLHRVLGSALGAGTSQQVTWTQSPCVTVSFRVLFLSPIFFFIIIICALILAVFRELSLKAVEVSPEWNKVLNQCEMLRKRVSIHILSSLWVAPENNDPISYTEAKGQDRGKKLTQL